MQRLWPGHFRSWPRWILSQSQIGQNVCCGKDKNQYVHIFTVNIINVLVLSCFLITVIKYLKGHSCTGLWGRFLFVKSKSPQFLTKFSKNPIFSTLLNYFFPTFFNVMSPQLSDQMFQRSQVSGVALCMSKVKVPWSVSQSVSDKVTYWAVLDSLKRSPRY